MKSRIEILNTLPYFTGTVEYYEHQLFNQKLILTDGANYIRQACECYWLFDIITQQTLKNDELVITFKQTPNLSWIFQTTDLDNVILYEQLIQFSDFPLSEIKLFYMNKVCYLPGEH